MPQEMVYRGPLGDKARSGFEGKLFTLRISVDRPTNQSTNQPGEVTWPWEMSPLVSQKNDNLKLQFPQLMGAGGEGGEGEGSQTRP